MQRRVIGNLLLTAGTAVLLLVIGLIAYNAYEEYTIRQAYASSYATGSQSSTGSPVKPVVTVTITGTVTKTVTIAAPRAAPATWLKIPAIGVDTPVVESHLVNGLWQVPKFVAGHLEGTANPGEGHNVAMAGHIQSISSGNVFASLGKLKPGDKITVTSADDKTFEYAVSKVVQVGNHDLSVVQPGNEETLTLITCSGDWDAAAHDYTERTVAIAHLVPQTSETTTP